MQVWIVKAIHKANSESGVESIFVCVSEKAAEEVAVATRKNSNYFENSVYVDDVVEVIEEQANV